MRGIFANPKPGEEAIHGALSAAAMASPQGALGLIPAMLTAQAPSITARLLSPGMFVRIRLPIGEPHKAFLVIDRAIQSDQGLKYVFVVDKDNTLQSRRIATGALQPDGLRVVSGVTPDDWVVVGALQQVRQRMVIKPEPIPMPSLGNQPSPDARAEPSAKPQDTSSPPSRGNREGAGNKTAPSPKSQGEE
jgi:multidrug efflux system membrane fusion protein